MKLILTHGYPYPYPADATTALTDLIGESAGDFRMELEGVVMVQFMHTVTVEFKDQASFDAAQKATGWAEWSPLVLEAQYVDVNGGYGSGVEIIVPAREFDGAVSATSTSFCNLMLSAL